MVCLNEKIFFSKLSCFLEAAYVSCTVVNLRKKIVFAQLAPKWQHLKQMCYKCVMLVFPDKTVTTDTL